MYNILMLVIAIVLAQAITSVLFILVFTNEKISKWITIRYLKSVNNLSSVNEIEKLL